MRHFGRDDVAFRTRCKSILLFADLPSLWGSALATAATGLGGIRFVAFLEPGACVIALVPQHVSECAPAGVQNRFGSIGLGQGRGIHVANEDSPIALHELGAEFFGENPCAERQSSRGSLSPGLFLFARCAIASLVSAQQSHLEANLGRKDDGAHPNEVDTHDRNDITQNAP